MEGRSLTTDIIDNFKKYLELQEKSTATIEFNYSNNLCHRYSCQRAAVYHD